MEKLRFDSSHIICVTSLGTPNGQTFGILAEYQPTSLHQVITNTSNYPKVRKTLNKRHQISKIWITLTDEISNISNI